MSSLYIYVYNVYKLYVCTPRRVDDKAKAALHGFGAAAVYYSYIDRYL